MDFFDEAGVKAIGSRLRRLTETITEDSAQLYKLYGVDLQPKWFPVFYALSRGGEHSITGIAKEIGHSHPSVSQIITEMVREGLVSEKKDKTDGRRNMVSLSRKGKEVNQKIQHQYQDVGRAIEDMIDQTSYNLWKAIAEWEFLLEQKPLLQRVKDRRKQRESANVRIVPYKPLYREAFKRLNEEWIARYFTMEDADHKALDDPNGYILKKGGYILVALYEDEPVGVCALLKMNDPEFDFELAKMAVSPKAQGKNIGWLLGQAAVDTAKQVGARNIYLESNTLLKPAINLYHKLGFNKVSTRPSPYSRSNIQMALYFDESRK